MRTRFIIALSCFLSLSVFHHSQASSESFSDVLEDHPHAQAIHYVQQQNIVQGYADGSYGPEKTINRAEFTKIIILAVVGQEPLEHSGQCFSDVASGIWFYPYVCYAKRVEIISGYPDGSFKPAQEISFVEAAKIIANAYEYDTSPDSIWYKPFVDELAKRGAIPTGILAFDQHLTRGQMAEMIYRLKAKVTDKDSQSYDSLSNIDTPQESSPLSSSSLTPNGLEGNSVSIDESSGIRSISSNGLPNHSTGSFPNANNPNAISEQSHTFKVELSPSLNTSATPLGLHPFGVALNGVPFDPGAAEFWNRDRNSGWQYEALSGAVNLGLDDHNAHVQPGGAYHYHGLPTGLIGDQSNDQHSALVGYAADGFPIYALYGLTDPNDPSSPIKELQPSYRIKSGTRPDGPGGSYDGSFVEDYEYIAGSGDLDECNGRSGVTPEHPEGVYHYWLTKSYPSIPRCFMGSPDSSFLRQEGGETGAGAAGGPPQAAVDACSGQSSGSSCSFSDRGNTLSGTCQNVPGQVACVPAGGPPTR